MSTTLHQGSCCGVKEICRLQDSKNSKEALIAVLKYPISGFQFTSRKKPVPRMGQTFFTQVDNAGEQCRTKYGEHFAKYLRNQKLGKVVQCSSPAPNPNYPRGHQIKIWIWTPNPKACWEWWKKNAEKEAKPTTQFYW